MTTDTVYGVRRAHPFNTVVEANTREDALDLLLPGDRLVESFDGGKTWEDGRARIVNGELRDYGSKKCDDCGTGLMLPGWLCPDCARDRGVR
jgi:hypothetical protein